MNVATLSENMRNVPKHYDINECSDGHIYLNEMCCLECRQTELAQLGLGGQFTYAMQCGNCMEVFGLETV